VIERASLSRIEIERTGRVQVVIGGASTSSYTQVLIAQETAEALGVSVVNVDVSFIQPRHGAKGIDTLQAALCRAAASLRTTAARMLRCQPNDVFLAENHLYSKIDFHAILNLEDVIRTTARTSGVRGPLVFELT
jgi:CO/xanthine dehydrogenase Mo-binding subunit